jgi:hypothetical protein
MSVPTSNGTGRQLASASSIHGTFPWEQRLLQKLTGKARGQWAGNRDDDWAIGATDNTGRAVVKEFRALGHASRHHRQARWAGALSTEKLIEDLVRCSPIMAKQFVEDFKVPFS